jgi:ribosomal protein S18 acetylase RimI-like enzyme
MTTPIGHSTAPSLLEHRPLRLRQVVEGDREALASFLDELSPLSSMQRFFTGGFKVTRATLDVLMGLSSEAGAFVAVEGERIVGHAMWGALPHTPGRIDIGFVVAEDRRRRGIGADLTRCAMADADAHGASTVEATVLTSNRGARALVRHLLPCAETSYDGSEIIYVGRPGATPCGDLPLAA